MPARDAKGCRPSSTADQRLRNEGIVLAAAVSYPGTDTAAVAEARQPPAPPWRTPTYSHGLSK
ncbi:hypothetical protein ACVW05_002624 [Pseudomonas fulva]